MKDSKYEEALERARAFIERGGEYDQQVMESIFPELKESEDERIRKNCIHFLELQKAHHADTSEIDECIAYLERMKEPLTPEEKMNHPLYLEGFDVGRQVGDVVAKPAEWSEEDETAYGDLIWCIEQAKKSAKDENDMGNIWFAENWVKNRLKSLRPHPHWKPSEEQMEALETAKRWYSDNMGCNLILESLFEQLKKLM